MRSSTRLLLDLQANTAMIVSYIRWTIAYKTHKDVFLFKTPKDVYLHVFAEPLTTSCLALLIAAAILAEATFLHIFTPLASQPNII